MPEAMLTTSVRIPERMYRQSRRIAAKRKLSFNALVGEALSKIIDEERDREMYEAATLLGADLEECSVEYARHAQSEVMLRDE